MEHITVLKSETIENLRFGAGSCTIDLTLGAGGHTKQLIETDYIGTLLTFDSDEIAIKSFGEYLLAKGFKQDQLQSEFKITKFVNHSLAIYLVNENFNKLRKIVKELKIVDIKNIIADLGWSSDQLSHIPGLSFEKPDEILDMRLDKSLNVKAYELLGALGKNELKKLFSEYADFSNKETNLMVETVIEHRKFSRITTVEDLNEVIEKTFANFRGRAGKNIMQSKARIYQALRIAVNNEFTSLKSVIDQSFELVAENGRLLFISFHSGEERIIDEKFTNLVKEKKAIFILDNKFLQPKVDELTRNINSRSAKLWIIEKNDK